MGYDTIFLVPNLGSLFYVLIIYLAVIILSVLLAIPFHFCQVLRKMIHKVHEKLFWSGILRFGMEIFMELSLSTILHLYTSPDPEGFPSIQFSNILAHIFGALIIALPLWTILFYLRNKSLWIDEEFEQRYGTPLDGIKVDRKDHTWIPVILPTVFMMRRLFFCLTVVLSP